MLVIDEIHSILAGTFREQRIVLNAIRFVANDLRIPMVCVGSSCSSTTISCSRPRIRLASASCKPTSSAERQAPRSRVSNCVVAMLPSSRRQFIVMVNSNFASFSIRQPTLHGHDRQQARRFLPVSDKTAQLWDFPTISYKDSANELLLLADLADATGGVTLQSSGQEEIQNVLTSEEIKASREKIDTSFLRPSSELTPLQRLLKWSVSDLRDRAISPFSELTVAEWVEK